MLRANAKLLVALGAFVAPRLRIGPAGIQEATGPIVIAWASGLGARDFFVVSRLLDLIDFLDVNDVAFLSSFLMGIHNLSISLSGLVRLFTIHDSLEQLLGVLVPEPVLLVLVAEGVRERQRVLQSLVSAPLEIDLRLDE